jgi:hypothetical protein
MLSIMACAVCSSLNESEFAGELMLHFPSPTLVTKPSVLTFPMISTYRKIKKHFREL